MKVGQVQNRPFYTREELKNEAKSAAISAGLSAGLTLAVNKGHNPSSAGRVGLLAAGISLVLGVINKAIENSRMKKANMQAANLNSHQG